MAWTFSVIQATKCIKLGCNRSSWIHVISGVLKGSVSGLILCYIYVNDMLDCLQFRNIIMHADDARSFTNSHCILICLCEMPCDRERITQYSTIWQLKLNVKKWGVLHPGSKFLDYFLNNGKFQTLNNMNDLDIIVDNTSHINAPMIILTRLL